MKKILSIAISAVLAVGLVAGLSGCGDKANKTGETAQTQSEQLAECREFILTADKVLNDYFSAETNPELNITESVGSYKGNEVVEESLKEDLDKPFRIMRGGEEVSE